MRQGERLGDQRGQAIAHCGHRLEDLMVQAQGLGLWLSLLLSLIGMRESPGQPHKLVLGHGDPCSVGVVTPASQGFLPVPPVLDVGRSLEPSSLESLLVTRSGSNSGPGGQQCRTWTSGVSPPKCLKLNAF